MGGPGFLPEIRRATDWQDVLQRRYQTTSCCAVTFALDFRCESGSANPYVGAIDLRDFAAPCHPHIHGQLRLQDFHDLRDAALAEGC